MFPQNAHFICRKCLTPVIFREKNFKKLDQIGYIGCHKCRQRTPESEHVRAYFKHYPWFVNFTPIMRLNGFKFSAFAVKVHKRKPGPESYIISDLTFICQDCGSHHTIDLVNTDNWTEDLYCRECGTEPAEKDYVDTFFSILVSFMTPK